jgi:hypothetical protein
MKYATKKIPKKTIDVLKNRTTKKKLRDIAVKYSKDK